MLLYQMLMMIWEAVLEYWQLVALLVGLLLLSAVARLLWRKKPVCHRMSLAVALVIALGAFFVLPSLFSASLSDLSYWVDWAFHLATVVAVFIYSYVIVLPFSALLRSKKIKH